MTVTQISVFVQSKPGHLYRVLEQFASRGISVRGFSAADTGEYGIVRFIVDRPDEALAFLESKGYAVQATPVLVVNLVDVPGALMETLKVFADRGINVVYCYSIAATCIAVAVKEIDEALSALEGSGLELLDEDDLAALMVS